MTHPSLGLIMIIKNERGNLERSLAPVIRLFDQAVVVDTGSDDGSAEYCHTLGAEVHNFTWVHDFSAARNHSIAMARTDWLFWLDADNALDDAGVTKLREALPTGGPAIIWALEKVVPSGERLWQKRVFPRHDEVRFTGRIHEQLAHPSDWPNLRVPVEISHWGYEDPAKVRAKGEYYLSLLNQSLEADPDDFYAHYQAAKCLLNLRRIDEAETHLRILMANRGAAVRNLDLWLEGNFMLCRLLENSSRNHEAASIMQGLLTAHGRHALVQYQAGRLAHADGRWREAIGHLELALSLGLDRPVIDLNTEQVIFTACYMLGTAYAKLDETSSAFAAYARAAEINPQNTAPLCQMARIHLNLGEPALAADLARRALGVRPGDRSASRILAQCREVAA